MKNLIALRWMCALLAMVGLLALACDSGDDDDDNNDDDNNDDHVADDDDADDDDSGDCPDADGDGFIDAACGGDDCNDADDSIYPGAEEICDDGVDQDCDNTADDGCLNWETEVIIDAGFTCTDASTTWVRCYALAFTPDGAPVVAVYAETAGDLLVGTSTSKGEWALETVDSEGLVGRDPSIDVDSTGRIAVAYYTLDTKEIRVAQKSPGGDWSIASLGPVGGFMDIGGQPYLRFNGDDLAQVSGFKYFNGAVQYWQENGEGEWVSATPFEQSAYEYGPVFDLDSQDRPGFVWQNEAEDYTIQQFFYGFWDPAAATGATSTVFEAPVVSGNTYHALAFDNADVPHVFYALGSPMRIIQAVYQDGNWAKTQVPDDSQQLTGPLDARRDPEGNLWVSYASDYPLTPRLARLAGETWTLYDVLDNTAGDYGKRPALDLDGDGLPGVVYLFQPDVLNGRLMFARMTGTPEVE